MTLIIDLQYFPTVTYYKISYKEINVVFDIYERHQKMSFTNRCRVLGAAGFQWLTVPIVNGRDQRSLIKDIRIANDYKWQLQHWRTLTACYNRSPCFKFYKDELWSLYSRKVDFLVDWNLSCMQWVSQKLGLFTEFELLAPNQTVQEFHPYLDLRNKITPKSVESIEIQPYYQVFEERIGFQPHASILDLLFCEGRAAKTWLEHHK